MALTTTAQDFQDDLGTYQGCSASVEILDAHGNILTDLELSPEEVAVMFTALRDFHA